MERPFIPRYLVNIESVMETKRLMLACHQSQFSWLDDTQGMASPIAEMERFGLELAGLGKRFNYAEAWHRHNHMGFCPPDFDPLAEHLGEYLQTLEIESYG